MIRILVADDKKDLRDAIEQALARLEFETKCVADGNEAIEEAKKSHYDLALVDLKMPQKDGMQVLKALKQVSPKTRVILMTAYASVETAIEALREEAVDYLLKPFSLKELEDRIQRVMEKYNLIQKKIVYPDTKTHETPVGFVGQAPQIQRIRQLTQKISQTSSPILILGESGTGKELLAQEIHRLSPRNDKPFVAINCVALAEGVLESELFGHEKGSFTGALNQKRGLFEAAEGGTILLDEIGELAPNIQVKLLRFLQEHEVQRVGGTKTFKVDVRIIAATNRKLEQEVLEKRFREDLWYRLNVFEVTLPPLRERQEDLPLLINHFMAKYQKMLHKKTHLSQEALQALVNYSWPGNIRELENVIERALVLTADGEIIGSEELPVRIINEKNSSQSITAPHSIPSIPEDHQSLQALEEEMIRKALEENHWNQTKTAQQLGIKRTTLQYRMQKLDIDKPLAP